MPPLERFASAPSLQFDPLRNGALEQGAGGKGAVHSRPVLPAFIEFLKSTSGLNLTDI